MQDAPAYGTIRVRQANVSYREIERATLDVMAAGQRPSIKILREQLGRGSPATVADALRLFWRDLGIRIAGDATALTRMPGDILEMTDGLWQRALALSSQAARNEDNSAAGRTPPQSALPRSYRPKRYDAEARPMTSSSRSRRPGSLPAAPAATISGIRCSSRGCAFRAAGAVSQLMSC